MAKKCTSNIKRLTSVVAQVEAFPYAPCPAYRPNTSWTSEIYSKETRETPRGLGFAPLSTGGVFHLSVNHGNRSHGWDTKTLFDWNNKFINDLKKVSLKILSTMATLLANPKNLACSHITNKFYNLVFILLGHV